MKKVVKIRWKVLRQCRTIQKVGDIIRADKSRRYVVLCSGKRSSSDTKVTDMLLQLLQLQSVKKKFTSLLDEIHARYNEIIDGSNLNFHWIMNSI